MILGSAGFLAYLASDAWVIFVKPVNVLPKMGVSAVKFVAEVAVELAVLFATMVAEVFERLEI